MRGWGWGRTLAVMLACGCALGGFSGRSYAHRPKLAASSAAVAVEPPQLTRVLVDDVMRVVRFDFSAPTSSPASVGEECALGRGDAGGRYSLCASQASYSGLRPGRYTFRVRAISSDGSLSAAAAETVAVPLEFSRCWGAASRDPQHPCHNASLDRLVVPAPDDALQATGYCDNLHSEGPLNLVCDFGVEGRVTRGTVALIGDSHAAALRRAMHYVAEKRGWRGVNLGRNGCAFSLGYMRGIPSSDSADCHEWVQEVVSWLRAHPEAHDVFITGSDQERFYGSAVEGYREAWRLLPDSIRHVYIIRDVPAATPAESDCVDTAIAEHEPAGPLCSEPRGYVLYRDAEARAAAGAGPRVHLIDLTPFFCGARCPPVVGGVLVLADTEHLTGEFSSTLGPYILRALG